MPKRIDNLKERILSAAKAELLAEGYEALTIRRVAAVCGIAVGTVYNYFPSKDMLAAAVMLGDWRLTLDAMRFFCAQASSVAAALHALYAGITSFSGIYSDVWAGCSLSGNARSAYGKRRRMLVQQLAACIQPVLERFDKEVAAETAIFLVENLLICTGGSDMCYTDFLRIVQKLL